MEVTFYSRTVNNVTKQDCLRNISKLNRLISSNYMDPEVTTALIEQKIQWQERYGALVKDDPVIFPGRKYRR